MKNILLASVLLLSFCSSSQAASWYVNGGVGVSGNGQNWKTAFKTIQEGINASSPGDEVRVAQNVGIHYSENLVMNSVHGNGVRLLGGFLSGKTTRDWDRNKTYIDGGGTGAVITVADSTDSRTEISGFHITKGYNAYGAGISCTNSNLHVNYNRFFGNDGFQGGAIFFLHSSGSINNNLFYSNTAPEGAAIWVYMNNFFTIYNNTIVYNSGTTPWGTTGSAVALADGANGQFMNNIVAFNAFGLYTTAIPSCDYSNFYGNGSFDFYGVDCHTSAGTSIIADPNLSATYNLTSSSPGINKGNSAFATWAYDIHASARIRGASVDIGADEY